MTGYGIGDVPHVDLGEDEKTSLRTADAAQAALMAEAVIQVT